MLGKAEWDIREAYTGVLWMFILIIIVDQVIYSLKRKINYTIMMLTHYILMLCHQCLCQLVNLQHSRVILELLIQMHLDSSTVILPVQLIWSIQSFKEELKQTPKKLVRIISNSQFFCMVLELLQVQVHGKDGLLLKNICIVNIMDIILRY